MISRFCSLAVAFAVAFACTMFSTSDVKAQGCQAGTPGCNAPAISQLNLGLANQVAQAGTSASASSAVSSPGFQQGFAFQPSAVRLSATLPQVQYVQAPPQIQYVQAPPQVQYVQAPQVQYQVAYSTAPQVQFSSVPFAVSQAPSSSASSSASTSSASSASSALPLVAAQPVALSACANGNCGGRQRLQLRKPVSRSISISRSRG